MNAVMAEVGIKKWHVDEGFGCLEYSEISAVRSLSVGVGPVME